MPVRLVPGERLPAPLEGYVLVDRLGRGGFGDVWKAEAPGGILKAIKFVFGDLENQDHEQTRAAEQERKALDRVKGIRHPYVLSLERYDIIDGQLIIVMELADRNLWDRFRECANLGLPGIPRDELLKYMDETAEALDLMNNHYHIQHLDIKPQNLFLVFNHVKVGDFGLAKTFEGMRGTVTGGVTPVYAAPETFNGDVYRFTDQYSLGIVFQELLTGQRPFKGGTTKQLLFQHLNAPPDLDALPPGDRPAIARALAKSPDQRWPSCSDMVRALKAAVPGGVSVPVGSGLGSGGAADVITRVGLTDPMRTPPPTTPQPTSPESPAQYGRTVLQQLLPTFNPPPSHSSAGVATPLPSLVTPRMASPGGPSPASLLRPPGVDSVRVSALPVAPAEREGNGVLMPALVVAVGRTGRLAAQKLRVLLKEKFGSVEAAPHVRFLDLDTDPDAAGEGDDPGGARAAMPVRLNRPHHYLARDGGPPLDTWMPAGMLYRLPRNPGAAAGVRAFGRLALVDNYRAVVARVRQEIDAVSADGPLDAAAGRTGLGVRTNRPRVYVLAGLAGGTGGGMFLDLAYLLKQELRSAGFRGPEAVGVLFVPPAGRDAPKTPGLANTYAALTELAHFQGGRTRYRVRYDNKEQPVEDADGPFSRVAVLQLSKRGEPKEQAKVAGLAARMLYLELFTPVGRTADAVRAEAATVTRPSGPVVQSFGMQRLSWPRAELLAASARRFAPGVLQRWAGKDAAHLREPVQDWLGEQWQARGLELDAVVDGFEAAVRAYFRENPERVFDAFADPLRPAPGNRPDGEAAAHVIRQLLQFVGRPEEENDVPGTLAEVLEAEHKVRAAAAERHLAQMSTWFIEQPQYRLPGAEEALNQIAERLTRTADGLEAARAPLAREALEAYARLWPWLTSGGSGTVRRPAPTPDLFEALKLYPRKRLRLLVLDATLSLYRAMLGSVPEYLREVGTCRAKLGEMATRMAADGGGGAAPVGPGRMILPHGVEGVDGAAELFLGAIPAEDLVWFDAHLQAIIKKQFKALVMVCERPEFAAPFQAMLAAEARTFLDARLEAVSPAAAFFRYRDDGPDGAKMIARAYEAAAPDLVALSGRELLEAGLLACPGGADGRRFRELAAATLPGAMLLPAELADDIAFVREYPMLPLAELPQLGPTARAAYDAQVVSDHTPHARADVPWSDAGATAAG